MVDQTSGTIFDVLIVGAGPSGLSAAIEAQRRGLSALVVEKGSIVNSIQHFPSGMTFFSTPELLEIGGIPFTSAQMRPTRAEGIEYYTRVASHYSLHCRFFETVTGIRKEGETFTVATDRTVHHARFVILAIGYYDHPNMLGVPGEDQLHVSHYYNEPYAFYRQNVMVVGAKNSAAIAALELYRHGAHVTIVHRGLSLSDKIKYWIRPDLENRIKEGSIRAWFNTRIVRIDGHTVVLSDGVHSWEEEHDFIFALTGYRPDTDFLRRCGIQLDEDSLAPVCVPGSHQTSVPGLFAAGSVAAGKHNNQIFIENGRMHARTILDEIMSVIR